MVIINKGQSVPEHEELEVFETRDYEDFEQVLCNIKGQSEPICGFEARYIINGPEVYR